MPPTTYDLTHTLARYLDKHFVLLLLEFLQHKEVYDHKDILQRKLDILQSTNMLDLAIDIHKELHPGEKESQELTTKRKEVLKNFEKVKGTSQPIIELFSQQDVVDHISEHSHQPEVLLQLLQEQHGFQPEMLDQMYYCAKFHYEVGNYDTAAEFLYHCRLLTTDSSKVVSALWGKLAAEILERQFDSAYEDMKLLKEFVADSSRLSSLEQLQYRTWLMHWSLFIFFNREQGCDEVIDMFLNDQTYRNTIQATCPHLLRYVVAVVLMHGRRRSTLKELLFLIQQDTSSYSDPITELFTSVQVDFDFDKAQVQLRNCEQVLQHDYFLSSRAEQFMDHARQFIFEIYCRIHNTISIQMLAEKLSMSPNKAEEWIVNLIRNASLDAKIDSEAGIVIMGSNVPSIHQQVIERTRDIPGRTRFIMDTMSDSKRPGGGDHGRRQQRGRPHQHRS